MFRASRKKYKGAGSVSYHQCGHDIAFHNSFLFPNSAQIEKDALEEDITATIGAYQQLLAEGT